MLTIRISERSADGQLRVTEISDKDVASAFASSPMGNKAITPAIDNGDGTITDPMTGLTWTKENVGKGKMHYADLENACKELTLGGRKWDFPSRAELLTLVDDTRYNPAIDTAAFPNCAPDWYWTKTEHPADKSCVFVVNFSSGSVPYSNRLNGAFLRAVSRAPAGQ